MTKFAPKLRAVPCMLYSCSVQMWPGFCT